MKINYKTVKQFVTLAILLKSAIACSSDDLSFNEGATPITKSNTTDPTLTEIYTDSTKNSAILLGERVGNPYNVDTLKKAFSLLYPNGGGRSATPEFHPTHYQLRFLPTDSLEFRQLMTCGLVFTTVPLNKKVAEEGTYYFDPLLEAQRAPYTWQYTIVPVTEELPNIRHEVMAQICAPNDGARGRSIGGSADFWPALEEKAYAMCGEETPSKIQSRGAGDVGMPGGNLKFVYVWDDKANQYIPAKGAKVVATADTWIASTTTDAKGSYSHLFMSYPQSQVRRLEIKWEGEPDDWRIFDGSKEYEHYQYMGELMPMVSINILRIFSVRLLMNWGI